MRVVGAAQESALRAAPVTVASITDALASA
jgi:hypothetical protein